MQRGARQAPTGQGRIDGGAKRDRGLSAARLSSTGAFQPRHTGAQCCQNGSLVKF